MADGIYYDINSEPDRVRMFQKMLRAVSLASGTLPPVAVDGVYGDGMEAAVRQYQAEKRLPVTGVVDPDTWRAVEADYDKYGAETSAPLGIAPFPNLCGYRIICGERSNLVLILQIMLEALCAVYDEFGTIPLTGIYDTRTTRAIHCFQRRNFIAESDCVDKSTWDALARQYNLRTNAPE